MTRMDNLRIINEALAGERPVDEQTHAAMAILAERLERLQQSSSLFAEYHVLASCEDAQAAGRNVGPGLTGPDAPLGRASRCRREVGEAGFDLSVGGTAKPV